MNHCDKKMKFEKLKSGNMSNEILVYETLKECGALKGNYYDYMTLFTVCYTRHNTHDVIGTVIKHLIIYKTEYV